MSKTNTAIDVKKTGKKTDKKTGTALAVLNIEADAGVGFEGADRDSYAIPMLTILQKMSPQCDESDGAFVDGAKPGMFFDNVNERVLDGKAGVTVIPVAFKRSFIEWRTREAGGGFVAEHDVADGTELMRQTTRNEKGHDILPNGNQLADTRQHYVLIVEADGGTSPALISFTSTQTKKSKRWMTAMNNRKMKRADGSVFTPPMFASKFRLTTVPESNDKGSWSAWKIEPAGDVTDPDQYGAAKAFRAAIAGGTVKAQHDAPGGSDAVGEEHF